MIKVLSIIDSFKGTLTSYELGHIMTNVLCKKGIDANFIPISDGGDGFLDTIEKVINTTKEKIIIFDPLNRNINSYYLFNKKNNTAYIELAKSSGINLLKLNELNPYQTSTFGLGQTIDKAIKKGVKTIIVGIGGSATNDGGSGMLEALGCVFYDNYGNILHNLSGESIKKISKIDPVPFYEKISNINFIVLSDVKNGLLGINGATYVYSKQKGAKDEDLIILENNMKSYSKVVEELFQERFHDFDGSGAAGGVGFAFHSFFKAKFYPGIEYLLNLVDFDNLIKDYDYIITGEGKIDKQSFDGKVIFGITKRANNKKIILVCAINELSNDDFLNHNNIKVYSIVDNIASLEVSMNNPIKNFQLLCESIKLS